jgi:hypothetical protein
MSADFEKLDFPGGALNFGELFSLPGSFSTLGEPGSK